MDSEEMIKKMRVDKQQYEKLKDKFDLDFDIYLEIVSKPNGCKFINNLINSL